MKKKSKLTTIVFVLVIFLLICKSVASITLNSNSEGSVTYRNEQTGVSFEDSLSEAEVAAIVGVLDGKVQSTGKFSGVPSCFFTEDVSITIGQTTFALACDGCAIVKNCSSNNYIDLSEEERATLEQIFVSRGGTFPVG